MCIRNLILNNMNMNANTKNIKGVFQNTFLMVIPYYQRRYVWKEENWDRFFKDMTETVTNTSHYFLGALILKDVAPSQDETIKGISNKSIVVDGQQRLTTLAIFMKILHYLNDDAQRNDFVAYYLQQDSLHTPIIQHNMEDRPAFSQIMALDSLAPHSELSSRLWQAYNFFLSKLKEYKGEGNSLRLLLTSIYARVNFVVITLDSNDDEQQIFDTLNSLGVDLTTDELLKNYLYGVNDKQLYLNTWMKIFDTDEARNYWGTTASSSRQSKRDTVLDRFLNAFVKLKMWDFKDDLTNSDKKEFVKKENAYKACKAFHDRFGMKKIDLANEIIEYAKIYQKNFDSKFLDKRIPQAGSIERISVYIQSTQAYVAAPYILYVLKNIQDQSKCNEIFTLLEIYLVRRAVNHSSNNNYSDLFGENLIGNHIKSYNELKDYIDKRAHGSTLEMPSSVDLGTNIPMKPIDTNVAKTVFYLYETKIHGSEQFPYTYNQCESDQLWPTPTKYSENTWPIPAGKNSATAKDKIRQLGNVFLLAPITDDKDRKNVKAVQNKAFSEKKFVYKEKSKGIGTQNVLDGKNDWTFDDILERSKSLAKAINGIWPTE